MTLTLLVKGDAREALKAARAHGFDAKRMEAREIVSPPGTERIETRLTFQAARPVHEGLAVAWFNEPGEAPYPVGALLFYQCA